MFDNVYAGRRVLVTGHTGFKGSWLAVWLRHLGAEVGGFSLGVPTSPAHFGAARLESRVRHYTGDIRDRDALAATLDDFKPDIVFHLAAQALVRRSYADPALTFETNAIGTMNVLECLRHRPHIGAAVLITSDKAYRNVEWTWGYRENDVLGGEDPYSGSKGCAELIAHSYYHSFFKDVDAPRFATTRAGNVIGGGDWAPDRIVPDCVRAWSCRQTVTIRHPRATRPWQHVLEPLSGYLWLGAKLWQKDPRATGTAYNFGPDALVTQPVQSLIELLALDWPGAAWTIDPSGRDTKPEATLLKLSTDKALAELRWSAVLGFEEAVRFTSSWYQAFYRDPSRDVLDVTLAQIDEYAGLARARRQPWTQEPS